MGVRWVSVKERSGLRTKGQLYQMDMYTSEGEQVVKGKMGDSIRMSNRLRGRERGHKRGKAVKWG